jgi:hypothetical protein
MNKFKKGRELTEHFRTEFGGLVCTELQQQFTGRAYGMWGAKEYKAFFDARGKGCAHAMAAAELRTAVCKIGTGGLDPREMVKIYAGRNYDAWYL